VLVLIERGADGQGPILDRQGPPTESRFLLKATKFVRRGRFFTFPDV